MEQSTIDGDEHTKPSPNDSGVARMLEEAMLDAGQGNGHSSRRGRKGVAPGPKESRDAGAWVVHLFAAFYLIVMTIAWFTSNRVTSGDYFAQSALVLTSIGLYHAPPPGRGKG
jgi:hypothetical protein